MMCLLRGQRSQTLVSLSTDCMYLNNSGFVIYISKLLKTSHSKSQQQPTEFKAYPHVSLCVVALIKLYLDKTAVLRHDVNSMFFISYALPHTNQCHQEHCQDEYQIFYKRQVFIPKHLKLILSIQH